MYFVIIDLHQLNTRLRNSTGQHGVNLDVWLKRQRFVQSGDGWLGTADSMNSLSCSEIVFSERRLLTMPSRQERFSQIAG